MHNFDVYPIIDLKSAECAKMNEEEKKKVEIQNEISKEMRENWNEDVKTVKRNLSLQTNA